jgi:hypothetical protein
MCTHCVYPAESLTWDEVCELWDDGVYNAKDVQIIASLYFEGAELSAVRDVIENVENESQALEAMNTDPWDDPWDYDIQPAAMSIDNGMFECAEPRSMLNLLEPDRNNPWHGLH